LNFGFVSDFDNQISELYNRDKEKKGGEDENRGTGKMGYGI
jgi:hypothetical protein